MALTKAVIGDCPRSKIVRDWRLFRIRILFGIGDCPGFGDCQGLKTVQGLDYPLSETVQGLLNKAVFLRLSK